MNTELMRKRIFRTFTETHGKCSKDSKNWTIWEARKIEGSSGVTAKTEMIR